MKKNIPGKYTWWEKDSDEEGAGARADWIDREASDPEAEMTEMEKQRKWVENDCPEPIKRTIMAREQKERARTGVKGVLADFDAWKLSADAGKSEATEKTPLLCDKALLINGLKIEGINIRQMTPQL